MIQPIYPGNEAALGEILHKNKSRDRLKDAKKELETPVFKIAFKLIKKFTNY